MGRFYPSNPAVRDCRDLVALLGFRDPDVARSFLAAVASEGDVDVLIQTFRADWGSDERALFERFYPDPVAERAALLIAVSSRRVTALKLLKAGEREQGRLKH